MGSTQVIKSTVQYHFAALVQEQERSSPNGGFCVKSEQALYI